jgi:DNA polymerase-3 subunit gamma/tau
MAGDAPGTAHGNPAQPGTGPPAAALALYRKYRPASFAEVKGQEHVTEPLRQALLNGRIHHAYLFSGPRGCGKTSSARILARSLNCEQGPTPDPCGVCASCVALAPLGPGSIDVIEIDAASHGGVDDARDLRERAFYAPVSGRFKIYIIDEAHMVTREGFNALLKLVEEPPPHLKFVFATTEPEKVIATIRSRTHHYPFRLVPPAVLRELLEEILAAEQVSYQPAVLPLVVRAGAGSVRDALSVLDQLLAGSGPEGLVYERTVALLGYSDDSLLDETVDAFAAGNGAAVFQAVDKVVEAGHDPRRFAADLLDRLRDLIILAAVPGASQSGLLDAPADRLERMAEQAGRFGQAELTRAADILSEGLIQMRGTTSPRLLLELMCAQVLLPAASTGEKALLARLERLEHQLAGLGSGGTVPAGGPPRPHQPGEQPAGGPAGDDTAVTDRDRSPGPRAGGARTDPRPAAPQSASSQPPGTEPGDPQPVGAQQAGQGRTRPGPAARPDIETFRQRWPEILDAVRDERKVAWILLRNTSAESVEGSVLTVAFASEGEARSFASSGHEAVLVGAVASLLGVNVRIRAMAADAGSRGPATAKPGGPPARGAPSRAVPATADAADPAADGARPAAGGSSGHAAAGPGTAPGEAPAGTAGDPSPAPGTRHSSRPGGAAGRAGAGRAGPAASPPASGRASSSAAGRAGSSRAGSARRQPRATSAPGADAAAEEPWPDEEGSPEQPGLSGMELIARQLGGQVIEEIDDS